MKGKGNSEIAMVVNVPIQLVRVDTREWRNVAVFKVWAFEKVGSKQA
jgi:hypothetical protein